MSNELERDYISSETCERFAEVCGLRWKRNMNIQEQLLFQGLEKLCLQAARYAKDTARAAASAGEEHGSNN